MALLIRVISGPRASHSRPSRATASWIKWRHWRRSSRKPTAPVSARGRGAWSRVDGRERARGRQPPSTPSTRSSAWRRSASPGSSGRPDCARIDRRLTWAPFTYSRVILGPLSQGCEWGAHHVQAVHPTPREKPAMPSATCPRRSPAPAPAPIPPATPAN